MKSNKLERFEILSYQIKKHIDGCNKCQEAIQIYTPYCGCCQGLQEEKKQVYHSMSKRDKLEALNI